jgi:predicted MFS family arabinose efflux permease
VNSANSANSADRQDEHAGVLCTLRELPGPVRVLLFGVALNRMGTFVALYLVLYLTDIGYGPSRAGVVLTVFGVGTIVGSFIGGTVAGRFGPRRTIVASVLLSAAATAAIGLVDQYVPLLLSLGHVRGSRPDRLRRHVHGDASPPGANSRRRAG